MRLKFWLFLIFLGVCYGIRVQKPKSTTTTTVATTRKSFRGSTKAPKTTTTVLPKTTKTKIGFRGRKTTTTTTEIPTTTRKKALFKLIKKKTTTTTTLTPTTTKKRSKNFGVPIKTTKRSSTPRTTTVKPTKFPIREPKVIRRNPPSSRERGFSSGAMDFRFANFTKRPLNFYVTANALHVTLANKTLQIEDGNKVLKLKYRESKPPFSIKNRGSVVLLGYENFEQWQQGRPNIQQMLTASGHTVYFVDLSPAMIGHKTDLLQRILDELKIPTNYTIISPDSTGIFTVPFLNRMPYPENFEAFIPTAICCTNLLKNAKFVKIPVLTIESVGRSVPRNFNFLSNYQLVHVQNAEEPWLVAENFVQPIVNFFDFIHPR